MTHKSGYINTTPINPYRWKGTNMSKEQIIKMKSILALVMFSMILMISGCGQDDVSDHSSKKPKPPVIDIHTAVISGDINAIKQHISAGTHINQKDPFGGSSPLISAALFNQPEIVTLLLDAGANIDFKNNDGSTALHVAAFFCRPDIVKLLLNRGADKSLLNNSGSTAYDTVAGPFEAVKPIYDMLGQSLAPMGLRLDYDQLKATRPQVAALLK
ncbi:MAG: ankyrin repeat domain-containing protein [Marinicella pacifica]